MAKTFVDAACVRLFSSLTEWILSLHEPPKAKYKYIVRIGMHIISPQTFTVWVKPNSNFYLLENFNVLLEEMSGDNLSNLASYSKQVKGYLDENTQNYVESLVRSKKNFAPVAVCFPFFTSLSAVLL